MQEELLDDTMRVSLTNLAEGVETLTRKMKILADLLDLKMIKNPPPSGIVVKAHQLIEDATCTDDTNKCFISEKGKYQSTDSTELQQMDRQKLTVGSKIGFSVENKSHEAYYVYLLNITARDGAFVAFPSKRESLEYALIKGKETRILEGVFNFRTPGHEILKIILSLKPLDPRAFEFEGTEERKREITKGPQSPLERLLNRSVRRSAGDFEHAPQPSEWGTIQAQMEVVKE